MLKLASTLHLLLFVIAQVDGCAPGTGILGTKASFDFVMIPPTLYTYCDGCNSNGQLGKDFAIRFVKSDVQNSINEVLQANSIPTNDVNPPTITFTPPSTIIEAAGTKCDADAVVNHTIPTGNTLYYLCEKSGDKYENVLFTVDLSVQMVAVQSIYQSQWNALASQVEDKLRAKRGAEFLVDPIVTVTN